MPEKLPDERMAKRDEDDDAPEVEGHKMSRGPEEVGESQRGEDDEGRGEEGHRPR